MGIHRDNWGKNPNLLVLSVVKEIQGMDMGYVEVQQTKQVLDKIFMGSENNEEYVLTTRSGTVLYSSDETLDAQFYFDGMSNSGNIIRMIMTEDNRKHLCMKQESEQQDVLLFTITDTDISRQATRQALPASVMILIGALSIALGYVYFTSRHLTRPIRQLQHFMDTTNLENLGAEIPEKISNDEIETLYIAYRNVLGRLKQSILNEQRISIQQLQAQFDLLQAQVNPHFIYNVLNVISNRGMLSDDEVICDICGELADMLRYATNTKKKYASIEDELQYTEKYLGLLKYRYEYKLLYHIKVDKTVRKKIFPKIVLQQIVENSVMHGFGEEKEKLMISVKGGETKEGWFIRVMDDGCGITEDKREELYYAMMNIRNKLTKDRSNVDLEIGGMGIVNSYARLYLLYGDKMSFDIQVSETGGTVVMIRIEEVTTHV